MAFATMHFATGMALGGVLTLVGSAILRRRPTLLPAVMTLGGFWAMVPDMPRLFTEDFPNAPFAATLGARPLRLWLETHGNWFGLHRMLDGQPAEFALHGMFLMIVFYNAALLGPAILRWCRRKQPLAA
ncbi:MAG: hypothetical protein ACIAXF_12450 [Phycisphaerales bacterium JB063]